MSATYTLVVTTTVPNPAYDPRLTKNYFGNPPASHLVTEHLRVTLTPDEFLAVKLAVLAEMQPKKDGGNE